MIVTIPGTIAAIVNQGGTFVVNYPKGFDGGSFARGVNVKLAVGSNAFFSSPEDFTVAYGASAATITYNGVSALAAGAAFILQLDTLGAKNATVDPASGMEIFDPVSLGIINLGQPPAASANAIYLSAALTAAALKGQTLTGAIVSGGVAIIAARTGRNIVAAWTGAAVLTVRGFDMYGKAITESSAAGTAFTGKKAFAKVTSIQVSADVTALTVGTGVVLGLPVYLPNTGMILKETQDGAPAVAGTIVGGLVLTTKPTATTADNRGTYAPNTAPDGTHNYSLLAALPAETFLGATQYAG